MRSDNPPPVPLFTLIDLRVLPVSDDESLSAARMLIREHFEAHAEAHTSAEIDEVLSQLPEPYVLPLGGLWVAWQGTDPVGCVALHALSSDTGEVKRMYVRPANRGHGVARALSRRVIEEARERGYDRLRLGTLASMIPAQTLYSSLGFVPIDAYRKFEFGPTLFYELPLSEGTAQTER